MTIQISFDMCFEFFAYVATGIQGTPPKGGRVGFPLLVVCASVLLSPLPPLLVPPRAELLFTTERGTPV